MTTAYLISKGAYSDYLVYFVSLDRAAAERIVARLNRGDGTPYEIEERMLVESGDEQVERAWYSVKVDAEGREVKRWTGTSLIGHEYNEEGQIWSTLRRSEISATSYVSYDVALKAARDELARAKAEHGGLT